MKTFRWLMISIMLACMMLLQFSPMQVLAAESIDLDKEVSLTISYQYKSKALAGAKFDIYLVATVDENGELTTTETFSLFNTDIRGKNDEAWEKLAAALKKYVRQEAMKSDAGGKTDKNGILHVNKEEKKLAHGLYLVVGARHTQGDYAYTTEPFMVLLPGQDKAANTWVYEVTAKPKAALEKIEDTPDEPEPTPSAPPPPQGPKLPQTGQLWWPVPILLAAGLLLVSIGIISRRRNSNEE